MSPETPYPQDRPAGEAPTQEVPTAPPYARPPEQAYPQQPPPYQPPQYQQQPPYQQQPQYQPPYDGQIAFQPPGQTVEHPRATLAFVLGLLSVLGLLILGPFGWYVGRRAIREMDRDPHTFSNRGLAMAGMVLGIVGTAFMLLLIALFTVGVVLLMVGASSSP